MNLLKYRKGLDPKKSYYQIEKEKKENTSNGASETSINTSNDVSIESFSYDNLLTIIKDDLINDHGLFDNINNFKEDNKIFEEDLKDIKSTQKEIKDTMTYLKIRLHNLEKEVKKISKEQKPNVAKK